MADDEDERHRGVKRRDFSDPELERLVASLRNALSDDWASRTKDILAEAERTMLGRLGVDIDDMDSVNGFRANLSWVKDRRAFEAAMIRQGVGAVILALVGGILTAVWFYFVGVKK